MPLLVHFLLVFSHTEQRLIAMKQFHDVDDAAEAYRVTRLERLLASGICSHRPGWLRVVGGALSMR